MNLKGGAAAASQWRAQTQLVHSRQSNVRTSLCNIHRIESGNRNKREDSREKTSSKEKSRLQGVLHPKLDISNEGERNPHLQAVPAGRALPAWQTPEHPVRIQRTPFKLKMRWEGRTPVSRLYLQGMRLQHGGCQRIRLAHKIAQRARRIGARLWLSIACRPKNGWSDIDFVHLAALRRLKQRARACHISHLGILLMANNTPHCRQYISPAAQLMEGMYNTVIRRRGNLPSSVVRGPTAGASWLYSSALWKAAVAETIWGVSESKECDRIRESTKRVMGGDTTGGSWLQTDRKT